jgi:hypothetical protein
MIDETNKSGGENGAERERVRAMLQAKLNAAPALPLDAAARFLRSFFADDSWEEAKEAIAALAAINSRFILAGLAGIEGLLADPPDKQGVLYNLVMWDANTGLDHNPTDEGAKAWLKEVAEMVREVLGDKQPPRPETG